jgi:DNA-binding transcriptional LysR family regulator
MELRNLKTFRAVAETLSFHRAAEVLHYAQSTVSTQIQDLEEELGERLCEGLGRGILLTESGASLLNHARRMVELEEEARAEVADSDQARGTLVVLPWDMELETALLMVWHRDKWLSPSLRDFMETARKVLK